VHQEKTEEAPWLNRIVQPTVELNGDATQLNRPTGARNNRIARQQNHTRRRVGALVNHAIADSDSTVSSV
jgi:hypothetical protein